MSKSRLILPGHLKRQPTELQKAQMKLESEINSTRAKILDHFGKAYLASTGLGPEDVVMVQKTEPTQVRFFFERRAKTMEVDSELLTAAKELLTVRAEYRARDKADADDQRALLTRYERAFDNLVKVVNKHKEQTDVGDIRPRDDGSGCEERPRD